MRKDIIFCFFMDQTKKEKIMVVLLVVLVGVSVVVDLY